MGALAKSLLLFALNWLDAQLTLFWVHSNIASEGNGLMNQLLTLGDAPFMLVKLAIGAFAAYMLVPGFAPRARSSWDAPGADGLWTADDGPFCDRDVCAGLARAAGSR